MLIFSVCVFMSYRHLMSMLSHVLGIGGVFMREYDVCIISSQGYGTMTYSKVHLHAPHRLYYAQWGV